MGLDLEFETWRLNGGLESYLISFLSESLVSRRVLHMCFGRFLLSFESHDLSQADKSIKSVFFPKLSEE